MFFVHLLYTAVIHTQFISKREVEIIRLRAEFDSLDEKYHPPLQKVRKCEINDFLMDTAEMEIRSQQFKIFCARLRVLWKPKKPIASVTLLFVDVLISVVVMVDRHKLPKTGFAPTPDLQKFAFKSPCAHDRGL